MKEGRFPSTGKGSECASGDPALGDQLFSDRRDRAPLEARAPGDLRARDGLMSADQIENNTAVYVASRFGRRGLEIREVNFTHKVYPTPGCGSGTNGCIRPKNDGKTGAG